MKSAVIFFALLFSYQFLSSQTTGKRSNVDLTIYNQNLSLIREERTLQLKEGISTVIIPDIPATIDGTSLHFVSLTAPTSVRVLEQNYQYDLVDQNKLLSKYLGKTVEFVRINEETKKEFTVSGTLLSNVGGIVAEVNGKIEINPAGRIVLPSLPEGLIAKPQLEWMVENEKQGEHKTEISYLAGNLSWLCNYVALINKDDNKLDVTGWVTITNNSGTSFKNAGLKLVAGDVNIVREKIDPYQRYGREDMVMAMKSEPQFEQSELFEYKLYSLKRKADINTDETKQMELASGKNVDAKKVFIYDGAKESKVGVYVTFKNEQKAGLGIPLPKGKVRVYKKDNDGKEQFIGEDQIDHTPKDEELKLYLGNAFDIVGERTQKDRRDKGWHVIEETYEIKLRNHKKETVEVLVYEHPGRWREWEILRESDTWEKVDQTTIKFPVKVKQDEEKVITYTIRYEW
ncbi:MAG: DUF4139 domain-containing protein [Ignavibacteriales bacterium]|nr:DUF4139 domain-containing protein [Ignavibacteriales bacterium]